MINPYSCYIISFVTALIFYQLGWSNLYPNLEGSLVIFLLITVLAHGVLSFSWTKKNAIKIERLKPLFNPVHVTIFIYCLWIVEFMYAGGIPLFKIVFLTPFDYRLFGVPSLHVFVVTFSSFYTVYLFQIFITERKKKILLLYTVNLLAALLIYNRGMLLFNLCGSLFIYLLTLPRLSFSKISIALIATPLFLFFFGVLGNLRVAHRLETRGYQVKNSRTVFLDIGQASENFRASVVPKEYFWTYFYVTSPLANLQTNLNTESANESRWLSLVANEFTFDFISKRVNPLLSITTAEDSRIMGAFNASTVYSRSYSYAGWAGMKLMALFLLVLPLGYHFLIKRNYEYGPTGIAILCTLYLFLVFENTIRFTGFGFQLVYPLVMPLFGLIYKRSNE